MHNGKDNEVEVQGPYWKGKMERMPGKDARDSVKAHVQ